MHVLDVIIPGTWPAVPEGGEGLAARQMLSHLEASFLEANVALNLFEEADRRLSDSLPTMEESQADFERRSRISREVEIEFAGGGGSLAPFVFLLKTECA
jgi:hypothetical protein